MRRLFSLTQDDTENTDFLDSVNIERREKDEKNWNKNWKNTTFVKFKVYSLKFRVSLKSLLFTVYKPKFFYSCICLRQVNTLGRQKQRFGVIVVYGSGFMVQD